MHPTSPSHQHRRGALGALGSILHLPGFGHSHDHGPASLAADPALRDQALGLRTIWWALAALLVTTILQAGIYLLSRSVALLGDTVHNLGDALNSIPLLVAFAVARRAATRRYSYGFGRGEDVAGLVIVASMAFSAAYIAVESLQKLIDPRPMTHLPWVLAAALVGVVGNQLVAMMEIRVGTQIGSAALVADGQHARVDAFTSLAVVVAVAGAWLGLPILDPLVGLFMAVVISGMTWQAGRMIWERLMDAVDPAILARMAHYAGEVAGVERVGQVRARWLGHRLTADITVVVADTLTVVESQSIADRVRRMLRQSEPQLHDVVVACVPTYADQSAAAAFEGAAAILPPRYQAATPSAAPMRAADLEFAADGSVAWDAIWTNFCDLALAGGPPHRGTLLEPVPPAEVAADPEGYARVLAELERGLAMVTGCPVVPSPTPGWIGVACDSEDMALWLIRAITVENICVRREGTTLYLPAGPCFRLEKEIKNVVTVVAKTVHYWHEHQSALEAVA
ncbi:MAG TPA: cation diffusion facilitator family transporter [Herpetosiphonaceae bacterium]|nr:cation diffusion facilitator family transporter [Herpetosiphonaceae bacterium]